MNYTVAGAIHMHSDYSHDGLDSLEALREACIARNIRWVGMTDHAEDLDPEIFAQFKEHCAALSDDDCKFVPGLEFRFAGYRGVHLFAVDLTEWGAPATFEEFFDFTGTAAKFTVLAHPVLCKYKVPEVVLDRIDGIEIWNTNYNTRYLADPRAIDLYRSVRARRPEVVATVGLDQHDSRNDRGVRTLIRPADVIDPAAALKAGRFCTIGRNASFDSQAAIDGAAMRKLRAQRRALDVVNRVHDRVIFTLRRMGVDP
jgi:hypothetical protein